MWKLIDIAKSHGWDTMPKDSPEYEVYAFAIDKQSANDCLEERANEVLEVKPRAKKRKTKKKGTK